MGGIYLLSLQICFQPITLLGVEPQPTRHGSNPFVGKASKQTSKRLYDGRLCRHGIDFSKKKINKLRRGVKNSDMGNPDNSLTSEESTEPGVISRNAKLVCLIAILIYRPITIGVPQINSKHYSGRLTLYTFVNILL